MVLNSCLFFHTVPFWKIFPCSFFQSVFDIFLSRFSNGESASKNWSGWVFPFFIGNPRRYLDPKNRPKTPNLRRYLDVLGQLCQIRILRIFMVQVYDGLGSGTSMVTTTTQKERTKNLDNISRHFLSQKMEDHNCWPEILSGVCCWLPSPCCVQNLVEGAGKTAMSHATNHSHNLKALGSWEKVAGHQETLQKKSPKQSMYGIFTYIYHILP